METRRFILSVLKIPQTIAVCACVSLIATDGVIAAEVVQRATSAATQSRPTVRTNNATSRLPTMQIVTTQQTTTTQTPTEEEPVAMPEPVVTTPVIEDKSSQFDKVLGNVTASSTDTAADARGDIIRAQRAALDSAAASATATQRIETALAGNANACDAGLRDCMKKECGNDFSKCAGDGDTMWGNKLDTCRRNLPCSGEEFQLFAKEIKADRDHNAKMASYNETIDCGNRYNSCIVTQCGTNFKKCLGKSAGDRAIADCATIANNCKQADTGLSSRTVQVFGTLRTGAEEQAKKDELRLYELRNLMTSQCQRIGAMFDERSLDCVFTVNFFAGDTNTLFASKKAYAGDTFDCTQNWFGVDITTYRENAYRLTREQTAASSSFMGAGLGVAAGAVASGAIDRAMDRAKADKALNAAEKQHEEAYGSEKQDKKEEKAAEKEKKQEEKQDKKNENKIQDKPVTAKADESKAATTPNVTNDGKGSDAKSPTAIPSSTSPAALAPKTDASAAPTPKINIPATQPTQTPAATTDKKTANLSGTVTSMLASGLGLNIGDNSLNAPSDKNLAEVSGTPPRTDNANSTENIIAATTPVNPDVATPKKKYRDIYNIRYDNC